MGILQRLADWFGPINAVDADYRVLASDAMDVRAVNPGGLIVPKWQVNKPAWLPNDVAEMDREAFRKSPLIFRAAKYVADAASSAPLRVYVENGTQVDEVPDHPMRDLIQRPNPQQGEAQFMALAVLVMQLAGYVVIEKERNLAGDVIGLWILRPDWLRPKLREGQAPDWEYRVPGYDTPFVLAAEDVITQTYQDTIDHRPTGIGPLEVALREVDVANSLTDFLKSFLDRGAMPLYFAIPSDDPEIQALWSDQARADAFRAKFRERYGGLSYAADIGIFGGIKDIKPLGLNFDELAFPQLKDLTDNAICSAFGVSPILLDVKSGLANSTYNNKVEARRGFFEDQMTFLWARLDDAFTRHLLPEFTDDPAYSLQFDVSKIPALKVDEDKVWQRAMLALKTGGITVNEYRSEIGLEKLQTGDVLLMPLGVSVVPVDDLGKEPELVDTTQPDPNADPAADPNADANADTSRSVRAVPPITEDDVLVSKSDVDEAVGWFDEQFPDFAGLLDAEVVEGDE